MSRGRPHGCQKICLLTTNKRCSKKIALPRGSAAYKRRPVSAANAPRTRQAARTAPCCPCGGACGSARRALKLRYFRERQEATPHNHLPSYNSSRRFELKAFPSANDERRPRFSFPSTTTTTTTNYITAHGRRLLQTRVVVPPLLRGGGGVGQAEDIGHAFRMLKPPYYTTTDASAAKYRHTSLVLAAKVVST